MSANRHARSVTCDPAAPTVGRCCPPDDGSASHGADRYEKSDRRRPPVTARRLTSSHGRRTGIGERRARGTRPAWRARRLRRRRRSSRSGRSGQDGSLASAIAFKQRCAVRYPDPCWQDPLTEAYGRALAGAVRALAPPPAARIGPGGAGLVGVDYRRCRQASCAVPASDRLTTANRRTTAFTSVGDRSPRGGPVAIDYWIYRPTIGWERIAPEARRHRDRRLRRTPLLESADPALVPLETLLGRDDAPSGPARSRRGGTGREPLGPVTDEANQAGVRRRTHGQLC